MTLAFRTIIVAIDFSPPSELALQYANALGATFGAALHLVHVVEEPFPMDAEFRVPEIPELRERLIEEAELQLAKCMATVTGVDVTCEVLVGTTAPRITEAAARQAADLIVMGTHGRGGVAHLIMGSVAEHVVRTAGCPVLTVRDTKSATVTPPAYAGTAAHV